MKEVDGTFVNLGFYLHNQPFGTCADTKKFVKKTAYVMKKLLLLLALYTLHVNLTLAHIPLPPDSDPEIIAPAERMSSGEVAELDLAATLAEAPRPGLVNAGNRLASEWPGSVEAEPPASGSLDLEAMLNGDQWEGLNGGISGGEEEVNVMLASGDYLYVGGNFTTAGGAPAHNIARYHIGDGNWEAMSINFMVPGTNDNVTSLAIHDGMLYVGGFFNQVDGQAISHLARYNTGNGEWSEVGNPDDQVQSLLVFDGYLYVGGEFREIDGLEVSEAARMNLTTNDWERVGPYLNDDPNFPFFNGLGGVSVMATDGESIFFAGLFDEIRNPDYPEEGLEMIQVDGIVQYTPGATPEWQAMGDGLSGDAPPTALASADGFVYAVGGETLNELGDELEFVGQFDLGSRQWTSIGSVLELFVEDVLVYNGQLIVAGLFNTVDGAAEKGVAGYDIEEETWYGFGGGVSSSGEGAGSALAIADGKLVVGGSFDDAGGVGVSNIARWTGSIGEEDGDDGNGNGAVPPEAFTLISPGDGVQNVGPYPFFEWNASAGADTYALEITITVDGMMEPDFSQENLLIIPIDFDPTETQFDYSDFKISRLEAPATDHFWRIVAKNEDGETISNVHSFTTMPVPEAFSLSSPEDDAEDEPVRTQFSWETSTDAQSYTLIITVDTDTDFDSPVRTIEGITSEENPTISYTLTATQELNEGTAYRWRVVAVNDFAPGDNESDPVSPTQSDETWSFTTEEATDPPAELDRLTITTHPVGGASGDAFATQPVIELRDAEDNLLDHDSETQVTVTIHNGTGGTLGGVQTVTAQSGIVEFTDLSLAGTVGENYTLRFTAGDIEVDSDNITVTHGAASQLFKITQAAGAINGQAFDTQPVVQIRDAQGNLVSSNTAEVTMSVSGDATVVGTATSTADNGEATFTDVGINGTADTEYTLTFSSGSLTSATQTITPVDPTLDTPGDFDLLSPAPGAEGVASGAVTFVWEPSEGAVRYEFEAYLSELEAFKETRDITAGDNESINEDGNYFLTFDNFAVFLGVSFTWQVKAINNSGEVLQSAQFTVEPAVAELLEPENDAEGVTRQTEFSWEGDTFDQYEILVTLDENATNGFVGINETSTTLEGLSEDGGPDPDYLFAHWGDPVYWLVRPNPQVTGLGAPLSRFVTPSEQRFFTVEAPEVELELIGEVSESLDPVFAWKEFDYPEGAPQPRYLIQVIEDMEGEDEEGFQDPMIYFGGEFTGSPNPFRMSNIGAQLKPDAKYKWRVAAFNNGVLTYSEVDKFTSMLPVPEKVVLVSPAIGAIDVDPEEVTFIWERNHLAASYEIQIALDEEFNLTPIDKTVDQVSSGEEIVEYLEAFTIEYGLFTVFWRVRAVNDTGEGPWSDVSSFTFDYYDQDFSNHSWRNIGRGITGPPGVNRVQTMLEHGDYIYMGGIFQGMGGFTVRNIVRYEKSTGTWKELEGGITNDVRALAIIGDYLYAGGFIVQAAGRPANGIARYHLERGQWSELPGGGTNGAVNALAVAGGELVVAGNFSQAGGQSIAHAAIFNPAGDGSWRPLSSSPNSEVRSLAVIDDTLFLGGYFTAVGQTAAQSLARLDLNTGQVSSLGTPSTPARIDPLIKLREHRGKILFSGSFTGINNEDYPGFAVYDPATLAWEPAVDLNASRVYDVATIGPFQFISHLHSETGYSLSVRNSNNGNLHSVAGSFNREAGALLPHPVPEPDQTTTSSIVVPNPEIRVMAGGMFTQINNQAHSGVAMLSMIGSDPTVGPERLLAVELISPKPDETGVSLRPQFSWDKTPGASEYRIVVSDRPDLTAPLFDEIVPASTSDVVTFTPTDHTLESSETYYWKVFARNEAGDGEAGPISSFETTKFYLAANEVTVMCPNVDVGDKGTVIINGNLETFTKRGRSELEELFENGDNINNPEFARSCVSGVTDLSELFQNETFNSTFDQPIGNWDVSSVTDMSYMFNGAIVFNQNLNDWDVSSVTDMSYMFNGARAFDKNLNDWIVKNVTNMSFMFSLTQKFDQNLNDWDVSSVTDMSFMFSLTQKFDQNLNDWDVSSVTNMQFMFGFAQAFNGDISDWEVDNVTNMNQMFAGASKFNGVISSWKVHNVENMSGMFGRASSFNQPIGKWADKVGNVTNMSFMFNDASTFNQDLNDWDVSKVENMMNMFSGASVFNRDISKWDVQNVENMSAMFLDASVFNQPLSDWDISSVTNTKEMFRGASAFNQPIGRWDVSSVTDMDQMFRNATSFNQDLRPWCVDQIVESPSRFDSNSGLQKANLPRWGECPGFFYLHENEVTIICPFAEVGETGVVNGVTYTKRDYAGLRALPGGNNPAYTTSCTTGIISLSELFKSQSGFNQPIGSWDVSSVTDMSYMFSNARAFNQPLGDWDVSNVTDMSGMFSYASAFNQNIGGWEVSNVTNMRRMFGEAVAFNQDIGGWKVNSVTDMFGMFEYAIVFNQNIGGWDVSSVTNMSFMFRTASAFNQDIGGWKVNSVTNMSRMFSYASTFNQDIGGWEVNSVTDMSEMFYGAWEFNQPIGEWKVDNVENMHRMFSDARSFNQPIGNWDVRSVKNMMYMFGFTPVFNQPIGGWELTSVTNMTRMFQGARDFNQNLSSWQLNPNGVETLHMFFDAVSFNSGCPPRVSSCPGGSGKSMASITSNQQNQGSWVWDLSGSESLEGMFAGAESFNYDISGWNISGVTSLAGMFDGAESFDQDLSSWDVSSVETFDLQLAAGDTLWLDPVFEFDEQTGEFIDESRFHIMTQDTLVGGFLRNSGLSTENYDAMLSGWSEQELQPEVSMTVFPAQYSETGEAALNQIRERRGWQVDDAGRRIPIDYTLEYPAGWNLVSLPMQLPARTPNLVFQGSSPNTLMSYQEEEFVAGDELTRAQGYWLYFEQPSAQPFDGFVHVPLRVRLQEGWNLIGSATHALQITEIEDPDQILKPGSLIGWGYGYRPMTVMQPGRGYWVYAKQEGRITLPADLSRSKALTASAMQTDTGEFSRAILSDGNYRLERFFDAPAGLSIEEGAYPLPPQAPAGLDARWEDESWLSGQGNGTLRINGISSNGATLTLMAPDNSPNRTYQVELEDSSAPRRSFTMVPGQSFDLPPTTIAVHITAEITEHLEFAMDQNFPNPFNPTTTIRYSLPEQTQVRLEVYTVIGQRVAVLVNGEQPAGWHVVTFDGSHLASGLYFYRLQAGSNVKTFKMTLVK